MYLSECICVFIFSVHVLSGVSLLCVCVSVHVHVYILLLNNVTSAVQTKFVCVRACVCIGGREL